MTSLSREALLVRAALEAEGLETPLVANALDGQQKREKIEGHMRAIMETLGLDLADDSLAETPHRIAKMYVNEIFSGLDYATFPKVTVIENKMKVDEMIMVLGLSKINRIVQFFARRPQVQERLTQQILLALQTLLGTKDVAISIKATHFCVKARGVMDSTSYTTTTSLGGVFKTQPDTRAEFLAGLKR